MNEKQEPLKFDSALARLEEIVASLESGKLTLEDSIAAFEEGMKLNKFCSAKLAETQKKVEILVKNSQTGELDWESAEIPQDNDSLQGQ